MNADQIDDTDDVFNDNDTTALKNAFDREKGRRRLLASQVVELQTQLTNLRGNKTQNTENEMTPREKYMRENVHRLSGLEGDAHSAMIETLVGEMDQFMPAELAARRKPFEDQLESKRAEVQRLAISAAARKLAAEIAIHGSDRVLLPLLTERLGCEFMADGNYSIHVRDTDGKPTTLPIEALADEFRNNPALSPVIRGAAATDQAMHARKVAAALGEKVH